MISKEKARSICHNWHGGQWSGLYQFGSSGIFVSENYPHYMSELNECLNPHLWNFPGKLLKKDESDLLKLKRLFERLNERIND